MIEITDTKIDETAVLESVKSELAGACVLFVGTTRRITAGRETTTLHYEAYREMAIKQFEQLLTDARQQWPVIHCSAAHRIGEVPVGESSVAVAVSSEHRDAAFQAAGWIMDQLKRNVPIWKQEVWSDGTQEWIHPVSKLQTRENR